MAKKEKPNPFMDAIFKQVETDRGESSDDPLLALANAALDDFDGVMPGTNTENAPKTAKVALPPLDIDMSEIEEEAALHGVTVETILKERLQQSSKPVKREIADEPMPENAPPLDFRNMLIGVQKPKEAPKKQGTIFEGISQQTWIIIAVVVVAAIAVFAYIRTNSKPQKTKGKAQTANGNGQNAKSNGQATTAKAEISNNSPAADLMEGLNMNINDLFN